MEERGLRFVRFADDVNIFVKSEMSANRVMKSVSSWLERKLFLKVSATKTKVVRPTDNNFLGFTFWKGGPKWQCRPNKDRKQRLYNKVKIILRRKYAVSRSLSTTFKKINSLIRGWINYFKISKMKSFINIFGQWLRHIIRVVILKQWKLCPTIYRNLQQLNKKYKCKFSDEDIYKVGNSRLGWYRNATGNVVNFLLSPRVLAVKQADRPGLINPLELYLKVVCA